MARRRQVRSQIKNLQVSERPDPFKPPKAWYQEQQVIDAEKLASIKCGSCISKGNPFTNKTEEQRSKISANWQF